jgi:hypothetical protein
MRPEVHLANTVVRERLNRPSLDSAPCRPTGASTSPAAATSATRPSTRTRQVFTRLSVTVCVEAIRVLARPADAYEVVLRGSLIGEIRAVLVGYGCRWKSA